MEEAVIVPLPLEERIMSVPTPERVSEETVGVEEKEGAQPFAVRTVFPPPPAVTWSVPAPFPKRTPFAGEVFAPVPPAKTERVEEAETAPEIAWRGPVSVPR